MGSLWLKIKIWTKGIVFGLLTLYALIFLLMNTGQEAVTLWFWRKTELTISPLLLVFVTFVLGIVAALLIRTIFTTLRQMRSAREQTRTERLEREMQSMKSKAAMLQRKPDSGHTPP